jgi:hypothetical protein
VKILIKNPDLSAEERTYLTSDYSSGTTLTIRNSQGFTDNYHVIVGEPGQEQTEEMDINGTPATATTITIGSALSFTHPKSCPVYESQWDQISLERKPSGGTYSVNQTADIDWDSSDKKTLLYITGGLSTDTYRWRLYSSATGNYSAYSDELVGTGLSRHKLGYIINQIKKNPVAENIDDGTIVGYANEFQALVYDEVPTAWWFVKEGTAIATAANIYKFSIDDNWSDFISMKYLLYRYVSGNINDTYPLTWTPTSEFYNLKTDSNQATDDVAKNWTLYPPDSSSAKGYIAIHPTSKTATCYIKPVYQFELTDLDSFGDEIVIPYPKGYIDYVLYRIYDDIKNDTTQAGNYNTRVARDIIAIKRLKKRQLGQPELTRFRGARGFSRLFGEGGLRTSSSARETYW